MDFHQLVFYFFATVLVFAAFMVITIRNPVKAAMFLVLAFFSAAGLWMLLEAEFLAITLVLVYVGAVMVLFLFVVMMLDINLVRLREGFGEYLPIGGLVAILLVIEMGVILNAGFGERLAPVGNPADYSNTRELGRILYTVYAYPFEIAAAILLAAIVAAIALTLRHRPETKYQNPAKQVRVRASERVRLVKMSAEKKS
jgi:NADH-quinone oxidoreductase subunit J